ncbi:MAG: heme biosynthesis HemY N-terminal domain-containing protein [Hyphomicrobiaceae bacterium]|nr:heme biosynthesis HemY N-terminal domain-containing protein [Hyphomicrobiaceae bacterium]
MLRLILFLAGIVAIASGLAWLADRPGNLVVNWEGYVVETSVFRAVVILAVLIGLTLLVWSVLRQIWESPAVIGDFINRRRNKRGLEALSAGMIAIGAGDRSAATRYAIQARKSLPNEPLTHLLRAQAAQLAGDKTTSRRIFEAMLSTPETEQLGLRGLFLEAEKVGEREAARNFAERAIALNPKLSWPFDALFDLQCKAGDWAAALETLTSGRKHGHIDKAVADRRRAVLLTAKAQALEGHDDNRAIALALEAHHLAPDLVPAAAIAGRLLASRGNTPKATKVIQKTWAKQPHPDLAHAYAYARIGDSPRDRLDRVKRLATLNPYSIESPIAVATAAIEAKDYDTAARALQPLMDGRLTQRACTLLARIEGERDGDKGAVREWLARAVNAPRDPAWTADGIVADQWAPVSPVTGQLDAFRWRVPVEAAESCDSDLVARKLEELVALGAPRAADANAASTAERTVVSRPAVADAAVDVEPVAEAAPLPSATSRSTTAAVIEPKPAPAAASPSSADVSSAQTLRGEEQAPSSAAGPVVAANPAVARTEVKPAPAAVPTPAPAASAAEVPRSAPALAPFAKPAMPSEEAPVAGEPRRGGVVLIGEILAEGRPPISVARPSPAAKPAPEATASANPEHTKPPSTAEPATARAQVAKSAAAPLGTTQSSRAARPDAPAAAAPGSASSPTIFISPRAPDDPGAEIETEEARVAASRVNPYRL